MKFKINMKKANILGALLLGFVGNSFAMDWTLFKDKLQKGLDAVKANIPTTLPQFGGFGGMGGVPPAPAGGAPVPPAAAALGAAPGPGATFMLGFAKFKKFAGDAGTKATGLFGQAKTTVGGYFSPAFLGQLGGIISTGDMFLKVGTVCSIPITLAVTNYLYQKSKGAKADALRKKALVEITKADVEKARHEAKIKEQEAEKSLLETERDRMRLEYERRDAAIKKLGELGDLTSIAVENQDRVSGIKNPGIKRDFSHVEREVIKQGLSEFADLPERAVEVIPVKDNRWFAWFRKPLPGVAIEVGDDDDGCDHHNQASVSFDKQEADYNRYIDDLNAQLAEHRLHNQELQEQLHQQFLADQKRRAIVADARAEIGLQPRSQWESQRRLDREEKIASVLGSRRY